MFCNTELFVLDTTSCNIVLGIFIGSFTWWLILCSFSIKFKERLTPKFMRKINLISGGLIFVFGILLVISIKEF